MNAHSWRWLAIMAVFLLAASAQADEAEDAKLFKKVMNRLLKNDLFVKEYPDKFVYPPKAFIKPNSAKEMNAYASAAKVHGAEIDEMTDKNRPVVMITQGLMEKVIKGDENSLAVIMGHELAHLTKDHVASHRKGETTLVVLAFGRDDEIEADLDGMRYAIAAGYPYKKGVSKAIREMRINTITSVSVGKDVITLSEPAKDARRRRSDATLPGFEDCPLAFDHQILLPGPEANQQTGEIVCRERLGGLLKYYHRQAA